MNGRGLESFLAKLTVLSVLTGLGFFLIGCGGEKGVDNGTIVGKVFSDIQGDVAARGPEAGVTVVIQRSDSPLLIRTTQTDANGMYVFTDVPLGEWAIGMAKEGFQPVTTDAGSTGTTAVGDQVRVIVDHHETSVAPEVTLRALQRVGNATVVITLRDSITGEPIETATVDVGGVSTSENINGVYTLSVPLTRGDPPTFGTPRTVFARISAEGYDTSNAPTEFALFANTTFRQTIALPPTPAVGIRGVIRFARFQAVAPPFSAINIRVRNIDTGEPVLIDDATGIFLINTLPASTPDNVRQVDLIISHVNYETQEVRGITLPTNGIKDLTNQPIILEPITVDIIGTVGIIPPGGQDNNQQELTPNGPNDKVIIRETGQTASIINGTYLIPDVPVQQEQGGDGAGAGLTLLFQAQRPNTTVNFCETVSGVRPVSDGTDNAVYTLRKINLQTVCGNDPFGGGGG